MFALALLAPTVDLVLRPASVRSVLRENRYPAPYPAAPRDIATLAQFPIDFEHWFSDRLGMRDLLLRAWQTETALALGISPSPGIILGHDGFDYFAGDDSERIHRGIRPATVSELESWTTSLEAQRDRCRRLGAEFVFVIAPNKQTIYPERWPADRPVVGPTRLDQFAAWLKAKSDVRFVDLRGPLERERAYDREAEGDFLYHPLGSHFTWRGGCAAWNATAAACADIEPAPKRLNRADFAARELPEDHNDSMWDQSYVGDHVHQRGYALEHVRGPEPTLTLGPQNEIVASTLDDPSLPSVLFVHDSFGPWMLQYAIHSCSRIDAVWTHRVPRELIERFRPRIVIQEATERSLFWAFAEPATDVEHVTEETFRDGAPLFGPVDFQNSELFAVSGGVSITRGADAWTIEQVAGDGLVVLPNASLPDGADLGLRLQIVAPNEGNLVLFFQTKTEPTFARIRSLVVNLQQGLNLLRLRTRAPGLDGGLKVRLSSNGTYLLQAFEMRVAR